MIIGVRTVSERKRVTVSSFRALFPTWCFRWPDSGSKREENVVDSIPFFPCPSFALQLRNQRTDLIRKLETRGQFLLCSILRSLPFLLFVLYAFPFLTSHCLTFVKMTYHVFRSSKLLEIEENSRWDYVIVFETIVRFLFVLRVVSTWIQSRNCRGHETNRLLFHWRLSVSSMLYSVAQIFIFGIKKNTIGLEYSWFFRNFRRKLISLRSLNFEILISLPRQQRRKP